MRAGARPWPRRVVEWVCTRCLRWFYRERLHIGPAVPVAGPVLLIGNHPNDLPDVLLGLETTSRPVRYLATVSAASNWAVRATYAAMGVIPVARVQDVRKLLAAGVDVGALNQQATDAVAAAFASGDVVAAFPEGGVRSGGALGDFRSGVAAMVLRFVTASPAHDVTVIPFGLQYEAPQTVGSDVLIRLGDPLSVRRWLDTAADPSAGALTRHWHRALRAVTRNSGSEAAARRRDQLVAAYAAGCDPRAPLAASAKTVEAAAAIAEGTSETAVRCQTAASALASAVAAARGIPTSSLDHARLRFALDLADRPAPVPTSVLWMGLPGALLGGLPHAPILAVIGWWARRQAAVPTDIVAACFVPGVYLVAAWYLLISIALATWLARINLSIWWIATVVMLLPRFGDLAIGWRDWYRGWRFVREVHRWSTPEREALRQATLTLDRAWDAAARSAAVPLD